MSPQISTNVTSSVLSRVKAKTSLDINSRLPSFTVDNKAKLVDRSSEDLVFSFILLDINHEAFNLGNVCPHWCITLFEVLKEVSSLKWSDIMLSTHYDGHEHNWAKTNYRFNFNEETLKQFDGVQFRLNKSKGRVHGFIVGNTFYAYWLDPHHNMSDSEKYGGVVFKKPEISCYEKLNQENIRLLQQKSIFDQQLSQKENDFEALLEEHQTVIEENERLKGKLVIYENKDYQKQQNKKKYTENFKKHKKK